MAGFNTAVALKNVFNKMEAVVAEPQQGELLARTLFQIDNNLQKWDNTYSYLWKEKAGAASDSTDRATDTTTTDVTYHEEIGFINQKTSAIEYSQEEIERAQQASANGQVNLDIIQDKAEAAHRAIAEWEDNLIFNGNNNTSYPIYGLTSDPKKAGFQTSSAPITLDKLVNPVENEDPYETANKIVNWLMDSANKVRFLPGFAGKQLILALPQEQASYIERSFSKYNPSDNVYKMLQSNITQTFSRIVGVPEFSGENRDAAIGTKGHTDVGMIFANTPDVAQIKLPMDVQTYSATATPDKYGKYFNTYMERMGFCIKRPQAFVRLNGIS